MARRDVYPRSELRVGGAVVTALQVQCTTGYRSPVATLTATVAPSVYGWRGDEAVRLALGYRAGLTGRFGGKIKGNSLRWSPKGVSFRAVGPLSKTQKATGIEDPALAPTDPTLPPSTERWAYAAIDTTDGALVGDLLALCGIANASIADASVPFATLAPSLTSRYAVRLASDRAPYDLIKEIDVISGCQTFDGPDGRVTRIVASGLPSGSAARTFTEGVDFSGQNASRDWSGDEVYNQITVIGQGLTDPETGLSIPIKVTVSAPSPFVDDPPGTNEFVFQSDLIESYDVATALATRLLGEKNRRVELITLPLVTGDPSVWPGMTVAVVSEALELDGSERCRVAEIQESKSGPYKTTLILEMATAAQGTDPNQAPIVAIAYDLEFETTSDGDPIAVATFTSDGTRDPDGTIASLVWDGSPVVPTPIGDGSTAVAVYDPLPTDPPPTVTLTATDNLGRPASATVDVVATPANSFTRELWIAEGDKLAYTEDQAAYEEYAVNATTLPEQAGDEYTAAATAAGAAARVLADGAITALAALAAITALHVGRDRNGEETGIAWAGASDGRIWRSVDFGVSWVAVAALPNGGACRAIEESPYASGDVYAGGGNVLYHSYDAGASWQAFYTNPDATLTLTRFASGIAAGDPDDPGDDASLMWLGFASAGGTGSTGRVVERGGALGKALPGGDDEPLDVVGLTISLDARRIVVADTLNRFWVADSATSGDLTPLGEWAELGDVRHIIRDGRYPIIWIASSTGTWKLVGEVGPPIRVRDEPAHMVAYGRLRRRIVGFTLRNAVGTGRVLYLGDGPTYDAPANWPIVGFDDADWVPDVASTHTGGVEDFYAPIPGGTWTTGYDLDEGSVHADRWLYRLPFDLPSGTVQAALLTLAIDDFDRPNLRVYVNGVDYSAALPGALTGTPLDPFTLTIAPVDLFPGRGNVVAIQVPNFGGPSALQLLLETNGGA